MRAETAPLTAQFADYTSRAVQAGDDASILVPALWSGLGLALSALIVFVAVQAPRRRDTNVCHARLPRSTISPGGLGFDEESPWTIFA